MKFGLFGSAKLNKIENDIDSSLSYNEWIDYNIEAEKLGFKSYELMATVSGILLYEKRGYEVKEEIDYVSERGNKVRMYHMKKTKK